MPSTGRKQKVEIAERYAAAKECLQIADKGECAPYIQNNNEMTYL